MAQEPLVLDVFGKRVTLDLTGLDHASMIRLRRLLVDITIRDDRHELSGPMGVPRLRALRSHGKLVLRRSGDERSVANSRDLSSFAALLMAQVLREGLDQDPERLHLHAGAVSNGAGATVIVGASESGKSTLTAGLVAAGWTYLSDESVAVDGVAVVGYVKPISVSPSIAAAIGADAAVAGGQKVHVPASSVGRVTERALVDTIVAVHFDPTAPPCVVQPLSVPTAAHRLVLECVDVSRLAEPALATLVGLANSCATYLVGGSDLRSMVAAVESVERAVLQRPDPILFHTSFHGEDFRFAHVAEGVVGVSSDGRKVWSGTAAEFSREASAYRNAGPSA